MNTAIAVPETAESDVLVFTDAAALKVSELIKEEGNANLKLRVFVSGGGCSGFQYGFTFDENEEEGDTCVEKHGVRLLIDPMSFQYLVRRRDRLQGRPRRRPVRDPQPERHDHLRLRLVLLRLILRWPARRRSFPMSSLRWTSGRTAFTWSLRATTTASSSSWTACANRCGSAPGSTSRAA